MCIVAIAWQILEGIPLVLISNRDEFYHRGATPLHHWADDVVIAGRDVSSQGTWLGMVAQGRWAVITNVRDGADHGSYPISRGQIIVDFLNSSLSPWRFAQQLQNNQHNYAGFNLICGDTQQAVYCSNRGAAPQLLAGGVYVLSNGLLSSTWQKCEYLRKRFNQELLPLLHPRAHQDVASVLPVVWDLLEDVRKREDHDLPHTGVSLAMEQLLSSTFIQSPIYGTRCSNFLILSQQNWQWWEKTQQGALNGEVVLIEQPLT